MLYFALLGGFFLMVFGVTVFWLVRKLIQDHKSTIKSFEEKLEKARMDIAIADSALNEISSLYEKERNRNKSVEVRTGQIMEKMAPLLDVFKGDHENAAFLGMPIDYILFNENGIEFVEVKTGGAQLTQKQRKIRDLIEKGKVGFRLVRIKPEEKEEEEKENAK